MRSVGLEPLFPPVRQPIDGRILFLFFVSDSDIVGRG
jgi:hypothetical protein